MQPDDFRAARKALGLTGQGLADLLSLSLREIRHYEAGTRNIPMTVRILLRILQEPDGIDLVRRCAQ